MNETEVILPRVIVNEPTISTGVPCYFCGLDIKTYDKRRRNMIRKSAQHNPLTCHRCSARKSK